MQTLSALQTLLPPVQKDRVDNVLLLPPAPPRFTVQQWSSQSRQRLRGADDQNHLAERTLAEGQRVRETTKERSESKLDETNHRLNEKLLDLEFRAEELKRIRKEITDNLDDNTVFMDRMHDCLDHLKDGPLDQNRKCITLREQRLGIDLTHDSVDCELRKEREVLQGGINMLDRMMEQMKEESRELRSQRYLLDRELNALGEAYKIDEFNRQLRRTDLVLSIYQGKCSLDNSEYSTGEVARFTELSLQDCAKRVHNARLLRSYVDKLLRQLYNDCVNQKNATDEAFVSNILKMKDIKKKMEERHKETMRLANEQTREMTRIDKALHEKEQYMALAHTRLGNRAQRPDQELVRDGVQAALVDEVAKICQSVQELQAQRIECQTSLRYLNKNQIQMEEDINVHTNTIKIDEVECMSIRQGMKHHPY